MSNSPAQASPGSAVVNGATFSRILGAKIDHHGTTISLKDRECLVLYVPTSLMLAHEKQRAGKEEFSFTGPRLGLYADTADVREGPYINHYINSLRVFIEYTSKSSSVIRVAGSADLSKSSIDSYWYKGPTTGIWRFEASFTHVWAPQ